MSSFYAKPSGTYLYDSAEGTSNIYAIYNYLRSYGYNKKCVEGILGNVYAESGLNPWLWENNTYDPSMGYGLFQFTPGSEYLNASGIPDHAPNTDTSQASPGADPDDAKGQLYCFVNDTFGKWLSTCWRSYWDPSVYPDLYTRRTNILNTWGNGSTLTMDQFKAITDYEDACFAFLACFEGPAVPNYTQRAYYAQEIKYILDPYHPINRYDILLMKKLFIDRQFRVL